MTFTSEQAEQIKQQLTAQIENSQLENKEQIKEHLKGLNEEQLEEFLKQNNLQFQDGQLQQLGQSGQSSPEGAEDSQGSQCIFCSIINGEVPSYNLAENTKAIVILELNPLSKGHSIILPKEHVSVEQLSKSTLGLAQKIAKKIKTKLKPEDVKIETASFMDHAMINVIPIYKDAKLEKHKAEESELQELQNILGTKKRGPRQKRTASTKSSGKLPQISFRIP